MRILLIEDNSRLSSLIAESLKTHGFTPDAVAQVSDAQAALATTRYDAIVLDLGLPDADGMTLLADFRSRKEWTPVLVLTAREGSRALIDGLNGGADDYMRKPFEMDELIARIRALLRRPGSALGSVLREANVIFDTIGYEVRVDGQRVDLTRRELSALELLMRRSGRVVPKAALEDSLYGFGDEVASNAIEVLVHRLRKKIGLAGADMQIHTLRGIGYIISERAQ